MSRRSSQLARLRQTCEKLTPSGGQLQQICDRSSVLGASTHRYRRPPELREQDLADRFAAAKSIAREAGAMALVRFRNRDGLAVERKGVQDQVTAVDR